VAILVFSKSPRILSDFSDDAATRAAKVKQFGAGSETADPAYKDLIRSTNLTGRAEMYEEQQRLTSTYNTLQSVAGMLKPVAGRKNLLWISGDFPFLLGRPEERAFGLGRSSDAARDADTDFQRTAKIGYNKAADDLVRALNLAGVAVYPVDARKLSLDPLRRQSHVNSITTSGAGEAGTINDIMKYLAHQTGGAAFSGGKELGDDVRGALDDLKRVWFLAFEPANPAEDGAFHSIKLQIQKKGYQVRTRVGYYAPDAATTLADPKQRLTTALASTLDLTGIGMTVRVQADPADSSSLTVSLDLDARDFQLVQQGENWLGVLGLAVVQGNAAGEQFGRQVQLGGVTIPGSSFEKAMRDGSGVHFDFKMKREPTASFLRFVVLDQRTPRTGSISVVL
jgi:VWFA-related protein